MKRRTLRRKLLVWLGSYLALLMLVVFSAANYVHERAEHAVWRALLSTELDSILAHKRADARWRWQDSDTMRFFSPRDGRGVPDALAHYAPGLHDEVSLDGHMKAIMTRDTNDFGRVVLALDIDDFGALESFITRWALLAGMAMALVTLLMAWIGVNRIVRPLTSLAGGIASLQPERGDQRVRVEANGSVELEVIAEAVNDYLERNERFVERERAFISIASHELRTPIAVIAGAAELALEQPDLPPRMRQPMQRVLHTTQGVEQLIQLLLVLARDPARLAALSEKLELDRMTRQIIDDHAHLLGDKQLRIAQDGLCPCTILAPPGVVQAAIGNLLRNAIENSDGGVITVSLSAEAVATIDDPGHGMAPDEISAIHARLARRGGGLSQGIGLELIARLCEHLGWKLDIRSLPERGTRVTLDMGASLPPQ